MLHKYFKLFSCLITATLAIYLSGCAKSEHSKLASSPVNWREQQKRLARLEHWQIQGKISIIANKKGHSANFIWVQDKSLYNITALTPLGTVHARITGSPTGISITDADNNTKTHASAEKLLAETLGWHIPIKYLIYWVKGLPTPTVKLHNAHYNSINTLESFEQAGWKISYLNYAIYNDMHLPQLLKMETTAGNKIKLFIKSWKTN